VGTINYLQAIKPDTAYIKKIIENSLLSDWAIRIEYQELESELACWQLWDNTFFALRSANTVVESLMKCYTKNPKCTIRINAEKFSPQSNMLFTVYNPSFAPAETEYKPQVARTNLPHEQRVSTPRVNLIS
jgi:ribulose bisphosphate carboxylase small subunit